MADLNVWKNTGELLFDTDLICYGLVKSGYMTYQQTWTRRTLRSAQLDPNNGANWFPVGVIVDPAYWTDSLYGFTITGAVSPIVFVVGPGNLNGTSRSGDTITFYYSCASTATKFYCFDLMADDMVGESYLKTWNPAGDITFNSLQPPLNVVAAVPAPALGVPDTGNKPSDWRNPAYSGGYNVSMNSGNVSDYARISSRKDIALTAGVEYAAYLPWSRSCGINDPTPNHGFQAYSQHGGQEGAFGRVGGITFMFASTAGTTEQYNVAYSTPSFFSIATDRSPTALVIETSYLPFPFN